MREWWRRESQKRRGEGRGKSRDEGKGKGDVDGWDAGGAFRGVIALPQHKCFFFFTLV
jgi:hypothetical protein